MTAAYVLLAVTVLALFLMVLVTNYQDRGGR
jgi:hypothetical protein